MTPKEKATELKNKFWHTCNCSIAGTSTIFEQIAKECALIAVEELIKEQELWKKAVSINTGNKDVTVYWQDVKKEIEKL